LQTPVGILRWKREELGVNSCTNTLNIQIITSWQGLNSQEIATFAPAKKET
jgi:hypothetical protein